MATDRATADAWPPFGLSAVHGDLLLREATDADVLAMAGLVEAGLVEAGDERFMPRLLLGRAATVEERTADFLRYHWGRRAATVGGKWDLALAVVLDGEVVGCQSVHADDFLRRREVHTGSYLARASQGRGVGGRMRAMVLELAFGGLGAQWASSGYVTGNEQSRRVSARLGYEPDGIEVIDAGLSAGPDGPIISNRLRLARGRWEEHRPAWLDAVSWTGVEEMRAFIGLPPAQAPTGVSQP